MANTFGILAALILAFTAFVAHKNKAARELTLTNIEQQESKKSRQTGVFDGLRMDIEGLIADKEAADEARTGKQAELDKQLEGNKAAQATLTTKKEEAASIEAEVAAAKDNLKELGDMEELGAKIAATTTEITGLEDDVALVNAQVSRLRNDKTNSTESAASLRKELSNRTTGKSMAGLRTRVNSVFRNYGFVTLAGGDSAGVVAGSKLSVQRNGTEIGQLEVTAVEANSSSANIIQSSIKEGNSISIGDLVVPAG